MTEELMDIIEAAIAITGNYDITSGPKGSLVVTDGQGNRTRVSLSPITG